MRLIFTTVFYPDYPKKQDLRLFWRSNECSISANWQFANCLTDRLPEYLLSYWLILSDWYSNFIACNLIYCLQSAGIELGTKSGLLNSNTCEVYTQKLTILSSFLKKLQPNLDQREIFHVSVETLGQTIVETPLRRKDSVNWINGKRSSRNLCHCSVYQRWFEIALLSKVVQSQGVACRQKIRAVKQFFQGQWLCKGANWSVRVDNFFTPWTLNSTSSPLRNV